MFQDDKQVTKPSDMRLQVRGTITNGVLTPSSLGSPPFVLGNQIVVVYHLLFTCTSPCHRPIPESRSRQPGKPQSTSREQGSFHCRAPGGSGKGQAQLGGRVGIGPHQSPLTGTSGDCRLITFAELVRKECVYFDIPIVYLTKRP